MLLESSQRDLEEELRNVREENKQLREHVEKLRVELELCNNTHCAINSSSSQQESPHGNHDTGNANCHGDSDRVDCHSDAGHFDLGEGTDKCEASHCSVTWQAPDTSQTRVVTEMRQDLTQTQQELARVLEALQGV